VARAELDDEGVPQGREGVLDMILQLADVADDDLLDMPLAACALERSELLLATQYDREPVLQLLRAVLDATVHLAVLFLKLRVVFLKRLLREAESRGRGRPLRAEATRACLRRQVSLEAPKVLAAGLFVARGCGGGGVLSLMARRFAAGRFCTCPKSSSPARKPFVRVPLNSSSVARGRAIFMLDILTQKVPSCAKRSSQYGLQGLMRRNCCVYGFNFNLPA